MADKCTSKLTTNVSEEHEILFRQRARQAGCTPAELLRDLVCVALTGETWGEHVIKDRRAALGIQRAEQGETGACK